MSCQLLARPRQRPPLSPADLTTPQVSILILGAGPTGLGAATRLQQHGHADWLMLDQVRALPRTAATPQCTHLALHLHT